MPEPYLTITPLGGHGEIGMNCQKWQTEEGVVLVDCGLMFPEDSLLGIDVVIPCLDSVFSEGEKVLGIVLTHGHEDHIGALPWLFLQYKSLRGIRIYGSPFTLALVAHKMEEHGLCDRVELVPMQAYSSITLGSLTFHFFPVCHSIPQSCALGVETPVGKIIHTGDFKLDFTPLQGEECSPCADFLRFSQTGGTHGIRLLLSDSTNVENDGRSLPERQVRDDLDAIFSEVKGRIIIALFSSHIRRIRTVLQLAEKYGRAVFVSGRSLSTNIEKAVELGLIEAPDNLYSEAAGFPELDPEHTVVLATGTQGEALSALARIVRGEHKHLALRQGDTVIMSSRVIPGNARAVSRVLNQIYRLGASVYHDPRRAVHATGHACREELKDIIALLRPEHFIPVHGEYRHLALHGRLAEECGVDPNHIHIIEDGQPITFTEGGVHLEKPVSVEFVLVDGKGVGDVGRMVLKERRLLGGEGLVAVILAVAAETGEVLYGPEMLSRGFVFEQQYSHVLEDAKCLVLDQLESVTPTDGERLSERIRSSLRRFFRDVLGRDPVVIPIVTQI
ncbi:ribonuclease J [uncultured Mailhella sp.]|uniref:ribonuclease J n=1 Tax=uncultured Mailhella sp. TaxID=1981031 RepID=UPI002608E801|nr:ribonuclease J [uncultured Mailhella sp.]